MQGSCRDGALGCPICDRTFARQKQAGRLLTELFLPSLFLASRERLSSEMRTQSKFKIKFGDGSMTLLAWKPNYVFLPRKFPR